MASVAFIGFLGILHLGSLRLKKFLLAEARSFAS